MKQATSVLCVLHFSLALISCSATDPIAGSAEPDAGPGSAGNGGSGGSGGSWGSGGSGSGSGGGSGAGGAGEVDAGPDGDAAGSNCTAPLADCDADPGNGCEVDLSQDGLNCGACARDCGGGQCVDGECGLVAIASGLDSPLGLAVDATHAYVSSIQGVPPKLLRVEMATGAVTELHGGKGMFEVAIDDAAVYFGSGEGGVIEIQRLPKTGGTPKVLATPGSAYLWIEVDASHVYWTTTSGKLQRVAKTGGSIDTLYSSPGPAIGLALDGKHAYVAFQGTQGASSKDGTVVRVAKASPHYALVLADNQRAPYQVTVDGGMLYYTAEGSGSDGTVQRVPLDGSAAPEVVVPNLAKARGVAVVGDKLVYSQGGTQSSLWRVALAGGPPKIVPAQLFNADRILAYDGFVYGTDLAANIGRIWKVLP